MNALKSALGTAIGFMMVVAFTGGIIALVLSLAAEEMPGIKVVGDELRCRVGMPAADSDCVALKLAALEAERIALEEEREQLGDVIAAQDFVFTQGDQLTDGVSIVVGTLYQNAGSQSGLIRSFCWAVIDNGGLDPRVGLAVLHSDGQTEAVTVGAGELALLEMNASEVDAARGSCPFPDLS